MGEPAVPSDLKDLLHKFVVSIIRDSVSNADLVDYSATFFAEQQRLKKDPGRAKPRPSVGPTWRSSGQKSVFPPPSSNALKIPADRSRRYSVSAETYDPSKAFSEPTPVVPKTKKELEVVNKVAQDVLLLKSLDGDDLKKVIDALYRVKVKAGDNVISQGDEEGKEFYIIESGTYDIFFQSPNGQNEKVGEYNNQGSFGELALLYNQPRAATITATSVGLLWALDRTTFQKLVLGAAYMKREKYMALLRKVEFLRELKNYELSHICDALLERKFKAKERILAEGDVADGMYIVESGEVVVTKTVNLREKELGKLGAGTYFGELALITKRPRAATVTASMDTRLAFLDVKIFERLLGPCMEILKRNITRYEKQLKDIFGPDYRPPLARPSASTL